MARNRSLPENYRVFLGATAPTAAGSGSGSSTDADDALSLGLRLRGCRVPANGSPEEDSGPLRYGTIQFFCEAGRQRPSRIDRAMGIDRTRGLAADPVARCSLGCRSGDSSAPYGSDRGRSKRWAWWVAAADDGRPIISSCIMAFLLGAALLAGAGPRVLARRAPRDRALVEGDQRNADRLWPFTNACRRRMTEPDGEDLAVLQLELPWRHRRASKIRR